MEASPVPTRHVSQPTVLFSFEAQLIVNSLKLKHYSDQLGMGEQLQALLESGAMLQHCLTSFPADLPLPCDCWAVGLGPARALRMGRTFDGLLNAGLLSVAVFVVSCLGCSSSHWSCAGVIKHKNDVFASGLVKASDFIGFDLHVQGWKRQSLKRWLHKWIAAILGLLRLKETVDAVLKVWWKR